MKDALTGEVTYPISAVAYQEGPRSLSYPLDPSTHTWTYGPLSFEFLDDNVSVLAADSSETAEAYDPNVKNFLQGSGWSLDYFAARKGGFLDSYEVPLGAPPVGIGLNVEINIGPGESQTRWLGVDWIGSGSTEGSIVVGDETRSTEDIYYFGYANIAPSKSGTPVGIARHIKFTAGAVTWNSIRNATTDTLLSASAIDGDKLQLFNNTLIPVIFHYYKEGAAAGNDISWYLPKDLVYVLRLSLPFWKNFNYLIKARLPKTVFV